MTQRSHFWELSDDHVSTRDKDTCAQIPHAASLVISTAMNRVIKYIMLHKKNVLWDTMELFERMG